MSAPVGPRSANWDHARQCSDREQAIAYAEHHQASETREGRWRVRPCKVCGQYNVMFDPRPRGRREVSA
jgi:hypothetical protein